jgi:hypothetical protein
MTTPSYSFESNADYLQSTALLAPQGDKDVRTNWDYGSTPTSLKNPSSEHFDSQDSSSVTPYTLFKKAKQRSVDNESPSCVQDLEDGFLATDTHKLLSVTKKSLLQRFEEEGKVPVKPEAREKESAEKDPVRWIMLVTMPVFMGYACLFSLQKKVKMAYGIPDDGSADSRLFGAAVSFLYLGNLVFRFAHNIIFFCVTPRWRVLIAMVAMMCSLFVLLCPVMLWGSRNLLWVFVAYSLGGVSIGSFEANLLSAITPLGHQTKFWATIGIPFGVSSITIGAFATMAVGVTPECVYGFTMVGLAMGIVVFIFFIPYHHVENNSDSFGAFIQNLREYQQWLPLIKWHSLALAVDMMCVSIFSPGVMLYVFDDPRGVPLWKGLYVGHDAFFAVYNFMTFAGESASRKWAYKDKKNRPVLYFLIFSLIGVSLNCFSGTHNFAVLCPLAGMFIFLGNGSIYNYTCKHIDSSVKSEHNLTACSFWLFIGDVGSTTGSNLIPYLKLLSQRY